MKNYTFLLLLLLLSNCKEDSFTLAEGANDEETATLYGRDDDIIMVTIYQITPIKFVLV